MAQSAIRGRIVTMDAAGTVLADGVAYIADAAIAAVLPADQAPPAGFEHVPRVRAGGTVYPGLIELHNHLSYNCLQLWQVPRPFANRGQWSTGPDYRRLISGPMQVIGKTPDLVAPLVRYVEAKCLVAGVTTSQGIALYSDAGIRRFYKGVVRNVEEPDDPALPAAASRIPDVAAADVTRFAAELERDHRLLLHLAEGTDDPARRHFLDLQLPDGTWALSDRPDRDPQRRPARRGHPGLCRARRRDGVVAALEPAALRRHRQGRRDEGGGRAIGLGSDWSPSGSKNLLGELKVARLYSANAAQGPIFTDQELVAMVTTTAAKMLGWDGAIGSLEAGKRADLIAVGGATADPYAGLIAATERDLVLVMIGGVACAGQPHLVAPYTQNGEPVTIGGRTRVLNFDPAGADPDIALVSLANARSRLQDALANLPELARALEPQVVAAVPGVVAPEPRVPGPRLALDEIEHTHMSLRTDPEGGVAVLPSEPMLAAQPPLSTVLGPLALDGLTAVDDPAFMTTLQAEQNLPAYLAPALAAAYARAPARR